MVPAGASEFRDMPASKDNRELSTAPEPGGGNSGLGDRLDSEEMRILKQSVPAEAVTRDFLQELLEEHRANRKAH